MTLPGQLPASPGQTIGPFYGFALPFPDGDKLVPVGHPAAVRLHGRVLDGEGKPVPDALLEIWQADAQGAVAQRAGSLRRDGYTFTGWGRTPTDDIGQYAFTTVVPGAPGGGAPFIAMTVFARGLLNRLFTRAYLPVDGVDLAGDPLLASLPADRRATLIARPDEHGFCFDVVLQGDGETVFLDHA